MVAPTKVMLERILRIEIQRHDVVSRFLQYSSQIGGDGRSSGPALRRYHGNEVDMLKPCRYLKCACGIYTGQVLSQLIE